MFIKFSFLFLLIILSTQANAQVTQEWIARHNGSGDLSDFAKSVAVDSDGNVYVTGSSYEGSSGWDFATIKYNSYGEEQWINIFGQTFNDEAVSLALDNDGNVYVTGYVFAGDASNDFVTLKYNSDGQLQWMQQYNSGGNSDDRPVAITVDSHNNIYVTGYRLGNGAIDDYDYVTIKYNSSGIEKWVKIYNSNGLNNSLDIAIDLTVDDAGNVYVTGKSESEVAYWEYATIKYDSIGNEQWIRKYHDINHSASSPEAIAVDNLGNVYVTGSLVFLADNVLGATFQDYATVKYNSAGVEQWVQKYNGVNGDFSFDQAIDLALDPNGNIYVTGSTEGVTSISDFATIKYNPDGGQEWVQIFNGTGNGEDQPCAIVVDNEGSIYVTGKSAGIGSNLDYATIKYNPDGGQEWIQVYSGSANDQDIPSSIVTDNNGSVYVTGFSTELPSATGYDYLTIKYSQPQKPRYPVFIVPGVGATYSANIEYDLGWILKRGMEPDSLQIDPLGRVYDDLIITLENLGYVKGKDLFVANYDWRLPPGPVDSNIDGHIDGISGTSITNGQFNFGVDYLGWFIKKACERWRQDHNEELDSIDIISHSTGGLVTRAYIQSDAYGGVYDNINNYKLPKIRNFVMIGVPNRGASKPWNPIHDNWTGDIAYRLVLSKIVNSAYKKVLQDRIVTGPDGDITKNSILDSTGTPNKELFINKYVPTIRYLLATYPFIDFGSGLTTVNNDVDQRNTLLLDLNNGFDINPLNDPNGFLDSAKVTVIYGTGETTKSWVDQRSDFETFALQSFTDFTPSTAFPGTIWYKDIEFESNGDGTVPTNSSAGQFLIDTRANMIPMASGDHTGLVSQQNVQASILEVLDVTYNPSNISTGHATNYDAVLSVILDPVEFILTDGSGNRLGYTNSLGAVTEIPNSSWFGNTDGRGWVFGSVQEPINLQLTGLGEDYYLMVSVEDSGRAGGVVLEGFLADGEVINYQITLDPVSVEQINSEIPNNFNLAQNYPNPFNPSTIISWQSPVAGHQTLKVYDVLGNEVATLVDEFRNAGTYEVIFDASLLASGIYFYRLQAGSFVETKKMILIR